MRTDIFRKVALDRLSSPEQLDQIVQTTTPHLWVAMAAAFLLLGAALFWGIEGSIPTKASGDGLMVRRGGVLKVVSIGAGVVIELNVNPGDHIKAGQVVARIGQPELLQRISDAKQVLENSQLQARTTHTTHESTAELKVVALQRSRENSQNQIVALKDQIKLLEERVPVEQQLLDKGLITKQQLIDTRQKIVDLEGKIADQQASITEVDAQIYAAKSDPVETDATAKAQILQNQAQLDVLEQQLKQTADVISPFSGEVIEVKTVRGNLLAQGSALFSIQPSEKNLEVLAYIASKDAKGIHNGMEAEVSPSTVKREESGYLRGKVESVADFPSTQEAMMRNFENQAYVESILKAGPVTEVHVRLEPDAKAPSGFAWSSPKSPDVKLSSGTICSVEVVTESKPPLALLLPWFKNATGL